jgi:hypothetical protein
MDTQPLPGSRIRDSRRILVHQNLGVHPVRQAVSGTAVGQSCRPRALSSSSARRSASRASSTGSGAGRAATSFRWNGAVRCHRNPIRTLRRRGGRSRQIQPPRKLPLQLSTSRGFALSKVRREIPRAAASENISEARLVPRESSSMRKRSARSSRLSQRLVCQSKMGGVVIERPCHAMSLLSASPEFRACRRKTLYALALSWRASLCDRLAAIRPAQRSCPQSVGSALPLPAAGNSRRCSKLR